MIALLDPDRIAAARRPDAHPVALEIVAETGSTNADLMQRVGALAVPTLRLALSQTAGRGRNGRSWHSVPGASLTFSLAWRFALPRRELTGLSLAVGVAVAEVLEKLEVPVRLKWPNDVLKDGKKLAGVLIEIAGGGRSSGSTWAVVGVGLNLVLPAGLESAIGQPAATAPVLARMDRHILMAKLLDGLTDALQRFSRDGLAPFVPEWNGLHAHAGQEVAVIDPGQGTRHGIAAGIDGHGRLLLDTASGRIAISSGDVSLRAMNGAEHALAD